METKTKSNGTLVTKPKRPPYMTKDQMHHVIAIQWSAIADLIDLLHECCNNPEVAEKLGDMKRVFFKPENQKQ